MGLVPAVGRFFYWAAPCGCNRCADCLLAKFGGELVFVERPPFDGLQFSDIESTCLAAGWAAGEPTFANSGVDDGSIV